MHRRGGRPIHRATIFRWASRGLRGVTLETVRIGGTICTSGEALARFFGRLSAGPGDTPSASSPPTPARRRQVASVDRQLDAMGV